MEHIFRDICSICIFALLFFYLSPFDYEQKVTQTSIPLHTTPRLHFVNLIFIYLIFFVLPSFIFTKFVPRKLSFPAVSHTNEALSARRSICQACKKHSKKCRWYAIRASRLFKNEEVSDFLLAVFEQKRGRRRAIRPLLGHNEHAARLQRGARCNAVRASLQSREALTTAPLTH